MKWFRHFFPVTAGMLLLSAAVRAEEPICGLTDAVTLMERPVKLSMQIDSSDQFSVSTTMQMDKGDERYCISNFFFSDSGSKTLLQGQALADEGRRRIMWRPPYLLALSHSGGRVEAYDRTWVFKVAEGRLTRIGALGGNARISSTGQFVSLYNKAAIWRAAAFRCEACRPRVHLVLDERDGKFAANAAATWRLNRKEWRHNRNYIASRIRAGLPPLEADSPTRGLVLAALIENAAIAKYCGRDAEVKKSMALAKANLDEVSQRELVRALREVAPLEIPDRWDATWRE